MRANPPSTHSAEARTRCARHLATVSLFSLTLLALSSPEGRAATAGGGTTCTSTLVAYPNGTKCWVMRVDPPDVQSFQLTVTFDPTRADVSTAPGVGVIFKKPFNGSVDFSQAAAGILVISGATASTKPADVDVFEVVFTQHPGGNFPLPPTSAVFSVGGVGATDFIETRNPTTTIPFNQIGQVTRSAIQDMYPRIWDPTGMYDDGTMGGAGVWDLSATPRFDPLPTVLPVPQALALADVGWTTGPNYTPNNIAVFGGDPGTGLVTVGANIQAGGLQFDMPGYQLSGGTLALSTTAASGVVPTIEVRDGAVTVNTPLIGTQGFTKAGPGTLILGGKNTITGTLNLNEGTVQLAGGTNTLPITTNVALSAGAALDLGGNSQYVNTLSGAGGIITSSGGAATFVINSTSGNFAGQMSGPMNFVKASTGGATFTNSNPYTGSTLLAGGTTTLRDGGALAGTFALAANYGTFAMDNTGSQNLGDRVNDTAPVTLRGGTVTLIGAPAAPSAETLGTVTLAEGHSTINATAGAGVSATLTLASLSRAAGATVNFTGTNLGLAGNAANIIVANPPALTNNLIGGWALAGGTEFASYKPTTGVGALNQTGYAGYTGTVLPAVSQAASNIRLAGSGTVAGGGLTLNSLNLAGSGTNVAFASGTDVLNLASGGLLKSGASTSAIGTVAARGQLTAGGAAPSGTADLFLYSKQSTLTVNSNIVNNGIAPVRLVVSNLGGNVALTSPGNTYTGGTVVNGGSGGALLLQGSGTVIPAGGLTLNGGTVTMVSNAGQIEPTNDVLMSGGSTLTLVGANTLAGLTFLSNGGNAPAVHPTGTLTLTGGMITSIPLPGAVPSISTGALDLAGNAAFLVTVTPASVNGVNIAPDQAGLTISSLVQNGGITKTGAGVLHLSSSTSTFVGGVVLNAGSLMIGANSTPSTAGAPVTSGPLGTATLSIAAGTTLLGSGGNKTIANAVSVAGDFTFGGGTASNNLTLNGAVNLNNASRTITVSSPLVTATIGSPVVNATHLTKDGPGTLVLTGTNTFSGGTTILGGALMTNGTLVSDIVINSGTIGGGATINGALTVGDGIGSHDAFLHPASGSVPGSMSMNSLSLNSDAAFVLTLDSASVSADELFINGFASLGAGIASLNVIDSGSAVLPFGTTFTILSNLSAGPLNSPSGGPTTGFFEALSDGALFVAGLNEYEIDYGVGPSGNDVQIHVVPELDPSGWLAAALLLAGCTRRARLRRR